MEERFVIKRKDFKKLERYAENIYNTAVVIDYFCSSQKEYKELYNLAPVGYKNVEINKRNVVVVDEEKAPFIKRLFELYASGLSASQVRKILYEEGLYHNTRPYAKSRLIQILRDC